jgi:hypothetical protein
MLDSFISQLPLFCVTRRKYKQNKRKQNDITESKKKKQKTLSQAINPMQSWSVT